MFADAVELALELLFFNKFKAGHKDLYRKWFALCRFFSQAGGIDRHLADMAEHAAFVLGFVADTFQDTLALRSLLWKEHQAGAIASLFRDRNPLK